MRTRGSYVGFMPRKTANQNFISGVYTANQIHQMQDDNDVIQWPTTPLLTASIDTTSLNETTNRTLTLTVNHKGYQQFLWAHIIPISGTITAGDFGLTTLYKSISADAYGTYETDVVTFEVAEDYTDETPDTETFRIEIKTGTSVSATTLWASDTISINDTSTALPYTVYNTSFSTPYNTNLGTSWLASGTVTTTSGVAGTGRWLWVIDGVDGYRSDWQINDFVFNSNITDPPNTLGSSTSGLGVFDATAYDAAFVTSNVGTNAQVAAQYASKTFLGCNGTITNSTWNIRNSAPTSSGTGIADGTNYFIFYESSGSFPTGGKACMLRSPQMTYTSSPTCSFSYACYSTVASDVGRVRLFWLDGA